MVVTAALFAALIFLVVSRVMDKRLLLLLNVTGTICENLFFTTVLYCYNTLDLRFLWLNGLFAFLGGGSVVFGAVVQAMLAESVPIQYLTSFYLFAQAAVTATSLLSSFLGLYLMQQNLWLPVGLGAVLLTLVIPLLTFFRVDEASMDQFPDHGEIPSNGHSPKDVSLKEACTSAWERFSQSGASMKSMRLFMAVMFAHVIGDSFRSILSLWMSKRYGWTIREVGYLLLAGAVFQVLLLPVLPWVLGFKRFHLDREGSLRLVRRSIIFSIAGSFMIGCSWNVVVIGISLIVCTFGVGFADGLHSCLAAGLEKRDISQVFICMSIVRMLGGALGAFVTGKLYGFSAGRENIWLMGLPMWVCTIMFILAALLSRRLQ